MRFVNGLEKKLKLSSGDEYMYQGMKPLLFQVMACSLTAPSRDLLIYRNEYKLDHL